MKNMIKATKIYWMVFAAVAFSFCYSVTSFAGDGKIEISQTSSTTFPIVLDGSQGNSYILTRDIIAPSDTTAIIVATDNISIDLNGFTITGSGSVGFGIFSDYENLISIKNGVIKGFGESGISLGRLGGDGHIVENIRTTGNNAGNADATTDASIRVYGGVIRNCVAINNNFAGFAIFDGIFEGNFASKNARTGITAYRSTVVNNTAIGNGEGGFILSDSTLINNTAVDNTSGNFKYPGSSTRGTNHAGNGESDP